MNPGGALPCHSHSSSCQQLHLQLGVAGGGGRVEDRHPNLLGWGRGHPHLGAACLWGSQLSLCSCSSCWSAWRMR